MSVARLAFVVAWALAAGCCLYRFSIDETVDAQRIEDILQAYDVERAEDLRCEQVCYWLLERDAEPRSIGACTLTLLSPETPDATPPARISCAGSARALCR